MTDAEKAWDERVWPGLQLDVNYLMVWAGVSRSIRDEALASRDLNQMREAIFRAGEELKARAQRT